MKRSMKRVVLTLVALAAVAVSGSHAAGVQSFPEVIPLPDGFQPEGIVISGRTFYVGSIPTGASYRGDLRSGLGSVLVRGGEGRAAIGIDIDRRRLFDHGRLFVAGGPTGKAFVYDARTGRETATYELATRATLSTTSSSRVRPPGSPTPSTRCSTESAPPGAARASPSRRCR